MNWFYAQNGQQAGPVDDAELDRLVQTGVVADGTLVWHSGLANWQPYAATRGAPSNLPAYGSSTGQGSPLVSAGPGQVQCSQCGRILPADEVIKIDNLNVCAECKPLFLQRVREGALVAGRQAYAGFGIRFAAAVLDGLILIPVYILIFGALFFFSGVFSTGFQDRQAIRSFQSHFTYPVGFVLYALLGCYSAFCVTRYGGTPGKRICKLRVAQGDGRTVSFKRGFARYSCKALPQMIPLLGPLYRIVDALFIVFDDQKRSLHDMVCDTRVVEDNPR